jgi:hypothetical protein
MRHGSKVPIPAVLAATQLMGELDFSIVSVALPSIQPRACSGSTTLALRAAADWNNLRSPEGYLGFVRTVNFGSPGGVPRLAA